MKEYTVTIGGVEHTVQLTDEDAKRLGAKAVEVPSTKAAPAPKNKAVKPAEKKA